MSLRPYSPLRIALEYRRGEFLLISPQAFYLLHLSPTSFILNRIVFSLCIPTLLAIGLVGCETGKPKISLPSKSDSSTKESEVKREPDRITVQHCLIGFKGSVGDKPIARTKEEAKELATKLLAELKAGADFDEVIRTHTDDSPPGIYKMANKGIALDRASGEMGRGQMVAAFGDTGFPLEVGEYGLAEYDRDKSPYGWHIVKRIQ